MALGIFDMDDTLVDGDSANLWLHYLVERGLAPPEMLPEELALLQAYREGRVDMHEYMRFSLIPLRGLAQTTVQGWLARFVDEVILPRIFPQALRQLDCHRQRQDRLLIISATGEHLVKAIAQRLGVADSIGIQLETADGVYTGETYGVLSYQAGKVTRLREWLQAEGEALHGSFGYSDSHNDIPLLEAVEHAHAVNPDATLRQLAPSRGWTTLSWHHEPQFELPPVS